MKITNSGTQDFYSRLIRAVSAALFVLAILAGPLPRAHGQAVKSGRVLAQPESPSLIVVPNGMAVVSSNGSDGATLRVVDISQFGTLWSNPANHSPNSLTPAQMPALQSWTSAQFNNSSGGPQPTRTLAIKSDGTAIYAGASGFIGASKTPTIWRIGPSTTTPQSLANLPSYVANPAIRRGIGGLDLDEIHNAVFASDLADGIIYRRDAGTGANLGSFDPLTVYSIGDTNLPPYGERVCAVAYNKVENRLYYAVWGHDNVTSTGNNTVRSVGLDAAGAFVPATDQLEFILPNSVSPVLDIEFNTLCTRMLLAEESLAVDGAGQIITDTQPARALEYAGSTGTWTLDPTDYDLGGLKYYVGIGDGMKARGGAAWGYTGINIFNGFITGHENFVLFTGDSLRDNAVKVFGLQFTPSTGGGGDGVVSSNSLIGDLDGETTTADLGVYGDIDVRRSLGTTSASTSISGRVARADGGGISRASVILTDNSGEIRKELANAFGYYRFNDVPTGETYFLTVSSKGLQFNLRTFTLNDELTGIDFTALE